MVLRVMHPVNCHTDTTFRKSEESNCLGDIQLYTIKCKVMQRFLGARNLFGTLLTFVVLKKYKLFFYKTFKIDWWCITKYFWIKLPCNFTSCFGHGVRKVCGTTVQTIGSVVRTRSLLARVHYSRNYRSSVLARLLAQQC